MHKKACKLHLHGKTAKISSDNISGRTDDAASLTEGLCVAENTCVL